jgi:hypothetical protein
VWQRGLASSGESARVVRPGDSLPKTESQASFQETLKQATQPKVDGYQTYLLDRLADFMIALSENQVLRLNGKYGERRVSRVLQDMKVRVELGHLIIRCPYSYLERWLNEAS